ncbi:type IX secretion system plug protein domain-containing protein, partial [uncultured Chryseobacterium sp.]|uniref:type IX secretion system plug protein n=1 Tax=uncultured Chryseobacterium sp. TaxID=259322 RepID=UPI00262F647B
MKKLQLFLLTLSGLVFGQNIQSIQLFNPQTNDETPVIRFGERLVLSFDDLTNSSEIYRYTIKHYDRNWNDDNLFFTEFANGSLNGLLDKFQYSFNTLQAYTHYSLTFPNERMQPKISGNYELIVYKDSAERPLFKKKFYVVEDAATIALNISRIADAKNPEVNQRVEVQAVSKTGDVSSNVNSMSLNVIQNNNPNVTVNNLKPSSTLGNKLLFQQMSLTFPGNNEFYYFDNKNIDMAADMVRATEVRDGVNNTYLHPVWAYPLNYQYQPDVNGA